VFRRVLDWSIPQVMVSTVDLQGRIDQLIRREKLQVGETHAAEDLHTSHAHPRPALSSVYEAPRNDAERLLADIWRKMFGIDQVGIHDNFFELGGDSVLNIQITARANQAGLRVAPTQVFEHPTIAALAAIVGSGQAVTTEHQIAEADDVASADLRTEGVSESDLAEIGRQLGTQIGPSK